MLDARKWFSFIFVVFLAFLKSPIPHFPIHGQWFDLHFSLMFLLKMFFLTEINTKAKTQSLRSNHWVLYLWLLLGCRPKCCMCTCERINRFFFIFFFNLLWILSYKRREKRFLLIFFLRCLYQRLANYFPT